MLACSAASGRRLSPVVVDLKCEELDLDAQSRWDAAIAWTGSVALIRAGTISVIVRSRRTKVLCMRPNRVTAAASWPAFDFLTASQSHASSKLFRSCGNAPEGVQLSVRVLQYEKFALNTECVLLSMPVHLPLAAISFTEHPWAQSSTHIRLSELAA